MQFVWAGNRKLKNTKLVFSIKTERECDCLTVCAVDFFRVFADGVLIAFGPARTAAGFSRVKKIKLSGQKDIRIEVLAYNEFCFACDKQLPFFGATIEKSGEEIYSTADFSCVREKSFDSKTPRYSSQRGFMEKYDFTKTAVKKFKPYRVDAPIIISEVEDCCNYANVDFEYIGEGVFYGFENYVSLKWDKRKEFKEGRGCFNVERDFINEIKKGYYSKDFRLPDERTGFIKLKINASTKTRIFAVMDELNTLQTGIFRRSGCNDLIVIDVPEGESEFISFEPYALKYLKILSNNQVQATPSIIIYENTKTANISVKGNEKLDKIFKAAISTFNQNVLDIFMDCPGRERAGWLCDSYFIGMAENLLMKNNNIERAFLENIIISTTEELDERMIPKCFPAQHRNTAYYEGKDNLYIPNWAMFFVLEVKAYYDRTGDKKLIEDAKSRILGVVDFLKEYENEKGLLENLDSWVFTEWSVCNEKDYLKGVSFPTNMLYSKMLYTVGSLYGDDLLKSKAEKIKNQIFDLSFNGEFFVENAIRIDGVLTPCKDHISETAQYYALFFGLNANESFKKKMMDEFGVFRKNGTYPHIGKSNMFIGNFLRWFWLCEEKRYDLVIKETTHAFYPMAITTGTLWEHNDSHASCNHGFASVVLVLLLTSVCGFKEVRDGKFVFEKDFVPDKENLFEIYYNNKKLY